MQINVASLSPTSDRPSGGLESVELTVRLIELLAAAKVAKGVTEVASDLGISKARAHRHLRCLVDLGYAHQDIFSEGYEVGIRVLALGEAVRERFDIIRLLRPVLISLSEASGFAVTLAGLVEGAVTVLEMVPGRGLIDFTIKPGARLDFQSSAHGLVALAYGPPDLTRALFARRPKGAKVQKELEALQDRIANVRAQGWATAVDGVEFWANALAAPVFDFSGTWRASIAIAGSSRDLPAVPSAEQEALILKASAEASHLLGWRGAMR